MTCVRFEDAQVNGQRGKTLLGPVSFEAGPGQTIVLCGPTGSGKSLLIELASGLRRPNSGRVTLNTADVHSIRPAARNVGLLTQDAALYDHLSVADNIGFGIRAHSPARINQAAEIACCAELLANTSERAGSLSGGERRRVALAKAIAPDPDVLLLDEPFAGLDNLTRQALRIALRKECAQRRGTTIIALHEITDAIALADEIVILHNGSILQKGTPSELIRTPHTPEVVQYFSETPPAIRTGHITKQQIALPGGTIPYTGTLQDGTPVDVVIPATSASIAHEGLDGWIVQGHENTADGCDLLLSHESETTTPAAGFVRVTQKAMDVPPVLTRVKLALDSDNVQVFTQHRETCQDTSLRERPR